MVGDSITLIVIFEPILCRFPSDERLHDFTTNVQSDVAEMSLTTRVSCFVAFPTKRTKRVSGFGAAIEHPNAGVSGPDNATENPTQDTTTARRTRFCFRLGRISSRKRCLSTAIQPYRNDKKGNQHDRDEVENPGEVCGRTDGQEEQETSNPEMRVPLHQKCCARGTQRERDAEKEDPTSRIRVGTTYPRPTQNITKETPKAGTHPDPMANPRRQARR